MGVSHNFSTPRSSQHNVVVKGKNRTLEDIARIMPFDNDNPKCFQTEAVSTTYYVLNRCLIRPIHKKNPYELLMEKNSMISHFKVFGNSKCLMQNHGKENLRKFDVKSDVGIFDGQS